MQTGDCTSTYIEGCVSTYIEDCTNTYIEGAELVEYSSLFRQVCFHQ